MNLVHDPAILARQLHSQGDLAGAERSYRQALVLFPDDSALRLDFASCLMQSHRPAEAVSLLREGLDLPLGGGRTAAALSLCLLAQGDIVGALEAAGTATSRQPRDELGWLAKARAELSLGQAASAERALRCCVSLAPRFAEAWHYLGEALQVQRKWKEAAEAYSQAATAQPTEVMNIAICAELAGEVELAREGFHRMCALRPERADCLLRLAQVEARMCEFEACDETTSRLERRLTEALSHSDDDVPEPFPSTFLPLSQKAQLAVLERTSKRVMRRAGGPVGFRRKRLTGRGRVRIGYISSDFGNHAVGSLLPDMLQTHDRLRFEVLGYSLRTHADEIAGRIRNSLDQQRDCEGMASELVAEQIRDDEVDVLIDLNGYTHGGRPEILAKRPAPVQLGWLGYLGGQQAPWLDGILLDEAVLPESATWPYLDTVFRLRGSLFPYSTMPKGEPDRARFGFPVEAPLLASFNNSYKLDAELLKAWSDIMRRLPDAHLIIYLPKYARRGFLRYWEALGQQRGRLHVVEALPPADHADRAASCDLFLDAFRYQGGATGMSSLASGLPILCRRGPTPLANLGVSINQAIGLDELICPDTASYVERAVAIASSRTQLDALRVRASEAAEQNGLLSPRRAAAAIEEVILERFT